MSDQTRATLRAIAVAWVFGVLGLLAVGRAVAAAKPGDDLAAPDEVALQTTGDTEVGSSTPSATADQAQATLDEDPQHSPRLNDSFNGTIGSGTLVVHAGGPVLTAYERPGAEETVARLTNPTRHGTPLVLQAITPPDSPQLDTGWVQVLLPIRPNGTTAWVSLDDVETSINPFSIEVDVDDFELTVRRHGAVYMQAPVGIGDGDTPTPHGSFFLTDLLKTSDPDGIYGPYAYGLSGYSETLTSFNGGEGVIGIHGTNEPWALGSNVSHGCVRVDNAVIEALATFLPLGTPVTIGVEP